MRKIVDTILPTTMVGSYPRPHWFTYQLDGRDVRVAFKECPPYARPDMAGRVNFLGKQRIEGAPAEPEYVSVPQAAVVRRGTDDVVFVVEGGTAKQVVVKLGSPKGGSAVVLQGLKGGETVVLEPAATLVNGERVAAGG